MMIPEIASNPLAPSFAHLASRVTRDFQRRFGRPPRVLAAAPGRLNLIGEHTDYNSGIALPCAIDRWVVVAIDFNGRSVSTIRTLAMNDEATVQLGIDRRARPRQFETYVLGVAEGLAQHGLPIKEVDTLIGGNLPVESGLSSSAALCVAFATAYLELSRPTVSLDRLQLARLCQTAEHEFADVPCGLLDMLAILHGRAGQALRIDFETLDIDPIAMPSTDQLAILLVDTHTDRRLSSGEYAHRRGLCEEAAAAMGIASLRHASEEMAASAEMSAPSRDAVSHVLGENRRVDDFIRCLQNDLAGAGELMFQSHESLRRLLRVSRPELNMVVSTAYRLRTQGVYGARLTGGGFGGGVAILCEPTSASSIEDTVKADFAAVFDHDVEIHHLQSVDGANLLSSDSIC